jgi:hypothetical protein
MNVEMRIKRSIYSKGRLRDALVKSKRSEISARDPQKPARELKTVNSIMMTKC